MQRGRLIGARSGESQVNIETVENGWIVHVENPPESPRGDPSMAMLKTFYKSFPKVLGSINEIGGRGAAKGLDEAMDSWKEEDTERQDKHAAKIEAAEQVIEKAFQEGEAEMNPPTLRKPVEVYVFTERARLDAFLAEVIGKPLAQQQQEAFESALRVPPPSPEADPK